MVWVNRGLKIGILGVLVFAFFTVTVDAQMIVYYYEPSPLNVSVGDTIRIAGDMEGGQFNVYWETVEPENKMKYTIPDGAPMGAFDFEIIVPSVLVGEYIVWIEDQDYLRYTSVTMTVEVSLMLDNDHVVPDEELNVTGYGYGSLEEIVVLFDDNIVQTIPSTIISDENGFWQAIFLIPSDTQIGNYTITASDNSSEIQTASTNLNVHSVTNSKTIFSDPTGYNSPSDIMELQLSTSSSGYIFDAIYSTNLTGSDIERNGYYWIDIDQDPETGSYMHEWDIGVDFMIRFGVNSEGSGHVRLSEGSTWNTLNSSQIQLNSSLNRVTLSIPFNVFGLDSPTSFDYHSFYRLYSWDELDFTYYYANDESSTITLDGNPQDWVESQKILTDPVEEYPQQMDLINLYMSNNETALFYRFDVTGEMPEYLNGDIRHSGWMQIYLDTDNDNQTGKQIGGIGAEFFYNVNTERSMIYPSSRTGASLYAYNETIEDWDYGTSTHIESMAINSTFEFVLPYNQIGITQFTPFLTYFDVYRGEQEDYLPYAGHYTYNHSNLSGNLLFSISGSVYYAGTPLDNITMDLLGGDEVIRTTVTNTGAYVFDAVPTGNYTIKLYGPTTEYLPDIAWGITLESDTNRDFYLQKLCNLTQPPDGEEITTITPTLSWTTFSDAEYYILSIHEVENWGNHLWVSDITDNYYVVSSFLQTGKEYGWTIYAYDSQDRLVGTAWPWWSFTLVEGYTVEIDFISGWNLVGFPYGLENDSIDLIFQTDLSKVENIFGFNRYTKEWNYWISGLPDQVQTLTSFTDGNGYWVKVSDNFEHTIHISD